MLNAFSTNGNRAGCSHPKAGALMYQNPEGVSPQNRATTFHAVCSMCGQTTDEYDSRDAALEALANLPRN